MEIIILEEKNNMGYLHLNSGLISDYSVEIVNESNDYRVIHLSIYTDVSIVSYRICTDTRQPNIDNIYRNLNDALLSVKTNANISLNINEYLERNYIFITYPDGNIIQYTASRI